MIDLLSLTGDNDFTKLVIVPIITASATSIVFTVIVPYIRNKRKEKSDRLNKHHNDIFEVYKLWNTNLIEIDPDLENFDINNLTINVVEQFIPIDSSENGKLTSLWRQAISHLNCKTYIDIFQKFEEIENQQEQFNDAINRLLGEHKKINLV